MISIRRKADPVSLHTAGVMRAVESQRTTSITIGFFGRVSQLNLHGTIDDQLILKETTWAAASQSTRSAAVSGIGRGADSRLL